jgi:signal transduction histidine kinase
MQAHGGTLTIVSALGKGTTVRVFLHAAHHDATRGRVPGRVRTPQ